MQAALDLNPLALQWVSPDSVNDFRKLVYNTVNKLGAALQYAPEELQDARTEPKGRMVYEEYWNDAERSYEQLVASYESAATSSKLIGISPSWSASGRKSQASRGAISWRGKTIMKGLDHRAASENSGRCKGTRTTESARAQTRMSHMN